MESFHVVIPARYDSRRFPGKPLVDLSGKTMIQRVVERAQMSAAQRVVVATDDQRIYDVVAESTTAEVLMTSPDHKSGSDRIAETVEKLDFDDNQIVVNIQGDEPLLPPTLINDVAVELMTGKPVKVATAAHPLESMDDWRDPNRVKCIIDKDGYAIYFSRTPVPWCDNRGELPKNSLQHIGIYAYRTSFLKRMTAMPQCALEASEKLEQLRILFNGELIAVYVSERYRGIGIDTPADVDKFNQLINTRARELKLFLW